MYLYPCSITGRTPACGVGGQGSSPCGDKRYGAVIAHLPRKQKTSV